MFENPNQENGGTEDQKKKKGTKDLGVAVLVLVENLSNNHKRTNRKDKKLREKEKKRFSQKQRKKLSWQESMFVSTYSRFLPQPQPSNDSVRRNFQGFWRSWRKKETKGEIERRETMFNGNLDGERGRFDLIDICWTFFF